MSEQAIRFECDGLPLVGILHRAAPGARRGVLIVTGGGPQYRAGGHRQQTLWARAFAAAGFPVFRFDYRGMGDSYGRFHDFDEIDADIDAAIRQFSSLCEGLEEIVLWGECNAGSAILLNAYRQPMVRGLVLLNPFVRTEAVHAKTLLKHYYRTRIIQRSFWKKVLLLRFHPLDAMRSLMQLARTTMRERKSQSPEDGASAFARSESLPDRMLEGLDRFKGPLMLILSGRDFTARELDELIYGSPEWRAALDDPRVSRLDLPDADHTFSSGAWRKQVADWGLEWLKKW